MEELGSQMVEEVGVVSRLSIVADGLRHLIHRNKLADSSFMPAGGFLLDETRDRLTQARPEADPQLIEDTTILLGMMHKVARAPVIRPGEVRQEYKKPPNMPWPKLSFDDQLRFIGIRRRHKQRMTSVWERALANRSTFDQ